MKKTIFFSLLLIVVAVSLAVLFRANSQTILLQGEVDAPEILVTSKAKGRVTERPAQRGEDVVAGQVLLKLEAPELVAQLRAAEAARDQAQAQFSL
ncbi:MAG: hypothetical protein XXXJIFNMEKO3_00148 [Candidatus Erwinia impunctatus]|nr:hypothetical protein XXXJIFNMEKO_00148 [Culicoides impunctatus]